MFSNIFSQKHFGSEYYEEEGEEEQKPMFPSDDELDLGVGWCLSHTLSVLYWWITVLLHIG